MGVGVAGIAAELKADGFQPGVAQATVVAVAKAIGKVEVDHGDTSCKTPDAVPYILKARLRAEARAA